MADLFKLQQEIPERYKDMYRVLTERLEDEDSEMPLTGMAFDSQAIAADYNDTLLLLLAEKEAEVISVSYVLNNLRDRKAKLDKAKSRIRETILALLRLSNMDKVSSTFGTSYKIMIPNGKFEIEDEDKFAAAYPNYTKTKIELDRKAIIDDLKEGVVIEGVKVTDRESIGIRR